MLKTINFFYARFIVLLMQHPWLQVSMIYSFYLLIFYFVYKYGGSTEPTYPNPEINEHISMLNNYIHEVPQTSSNKMNFSQSLQFIYKEIPPSNSFWYNKNIHDQYCFKIARFIPKLNEPYKNATINYLSTIQAQLKIIDDPSKSAKADLIVEIWQKVLKENSNKTQSNDLFLHKYSRLILIIPLIMITVTVFSLNKLS